MNKDPLPSVIEHKSKTTIRITIEAILWIVSAICTVSYVYINFRNSFIYWFVEIFWMTMIGFFVYDDSRKRYQKQSWNITWAVAVGIFFPLYLVYFLNRPPVAFKGEETKFRKKVIFTIIATIIVLILVLMSKLFLS